MLLYWIPSENRYVRTQGEAKKLGFGEETEVPTDKDGLMAFLNNIHSLHQFDMNMFANEERNHIGQPPKAPLIDAPPPPIGDEEPKLTKAQVHSVLNQVDVEEAIQNADAVQLASYANNVCWRIKELVPKS